MDALNRKAPKMSISRRRFLGYAGLLGMGAAAEAPARAQAATASPTRTPVRAPSPSDSAKWIARPLSTVNGRTPWPRYTGQKHCRLVWVPSRQKMFQVGGDYTCDPDNRSGSYQNRVWLLDPKAPNLDAAYSRLYPHTPAQHGGPGENMFDAPDEMAAAYDSARDCVWVWPGTVLSETKDGATLPGGAIQRFRIMKFNLDQNLYELPANGGAVYSLPGAEKAKYGAYDPVTDRLFCMSDFGGLHVYNCAKDSWQSFGLSALSRLYFTSQGCTIVPTGSHRGFYTADPYGPNDSTPGQGRLWRISLDNPGSAPTPVSLLPELPGADSKHSGGHWREDYIVLAYSSYSERIYYMRESGWNEAPTVPDPTYGRYANPSAGFPTIYYYSLSSGQWGSLPLTDTQGRQIRGVHAMQWAGAPHNCLVLSGGQTTVLDGQWNNASLNPNPRILDPNANSGYKQLGSPQHMFFYFEDAADAAG